MCNLQKGIKREVRVGKNRYKNKTEALLGTNNLDSAWKGTETVTRLNDRSRGRVICPIITVMQSTVAKINNPKTLIDFRPVALTSLVMKQFGKLIKAELVVKTSLLDPVC